MRNKLMFLLFIFTTWAANFALAQMLIKNSGNTEIVRIDQAGNMGINANNSANKLSVAGSVAIGASYAGQTAPANGLIVEGHAAIGTQASTAYSLVVNDSNLDGLAIFSRSLNAAQNISTDAITAISDLPTAQPTTSGTHRHAMQSVLKTIGGTWNVASTVDAGFFEGPADFGQSRLLSGSSGAIWAERTEWPSYVKGVSAIRIAGYFNNDNAASNDYGIWVRGGYKNFLQRAVGIGTTNFTPQNVDPNGYMLAVAGRVYASGGFNPPSSDMRMKENIQPVEDALETVARIRGVQFDWRKEEFPERYFPGSRQYGFIAQEVEQVVPELVGTDPDGFKNLSYDGMVPILLEAIKTLKARVEQLEAQNLNKTK